MPKLPRVPQLKLESEDRSQTQEKNWSDGVLEYWEGIGKINTP